MSYRIENLGGEHEVGHFDCGNQWLNNYLRLHAAQNQKLGYGKTYVLVEEGNLKVIGYYTIAMGSISFASLPDDFAKRVPKYPMPSAHIGCLAVDLTGRGKRLGELLLVDALTRIVAAADLIAARAVDVKAIDENARKFWLRYGFMPLRDQADHLFLPMKTVREVVKGR